MRHEGYNGQVFVDGQILTIVHRGMAARAGGLVTGRPRRIPLQAISGVWFTAATPVINGHLTLGLGGAPAPDLGMAAASDPNTVMFRWKHRHAFNTLHAWLVSVVQYNRDNGIDSSAVAFDPPAPSRSQRTQQRAAASHAGTARPAPSSPGGPAPAHGSPPAQDFRHAPPPAGEPVLPAAGQSPSRKQRAAGRDAFEDLAMAAARGDAHALEQLPRALDQTRQHWRARKLDSALWNVLTHAIEDVCADDVLDTGEEAHLAALAGALGLDFAGLANKAPAAHELLVVSRVNDGRPPTVPDPPIVTKRGEAAYGCFTASLMKEVTRREFRGGSSGVSIPLGFGVRYRTGGARGRSVVVGTDLVAEDTGVLVVTNTRTVYAGPKKTLEFRHNRLVGMQQYTDGLRLNVSNRQTASLFKFTRGGSPTIAAALIAHAVAQQEEN